MMLLSLTLQQFIVLTCRVVNAVTPVNAFAICVVY